MSNPTIISSVKIVNTFNGKDCYFYFDDGLLCFKVELDEGNLAIDLDKLDLSQYVDEIAGIFEQGSNFFDTAKGIDSLVTRTWRKHHWTAYPWSTDEVIVFCNGAKLYITKDMTKEDILEYWNLSYKTAYIKYAMTWVELMQSSILAGLSVAKSAITTFDMADDDGITFEQFKKAVSFLSKDFGWKYGKELETWFEDEEVQAKVRLVFSIF